MMFSAYARAGRFDQALATAEKYLGWAKTMKDGRYLRRLQTMTGLFREKKPYDL